MPGFEVIGEEEFNEVKDIFDHSKILFRHGFENLRNGIYKVREFEKAFATHMKTYDALAVTSGTAALKVALKALGIGKGDEVITQSFTFVATVEAIIEAGAQPIIAEIDDTLNLDPSDIEKNITAKTKAIIAVHMLGIPARMKEIQIIAKKYMLPIIEDTAWGCGAKLDDKFLGTIGDIGTYSFDFAKTITTGEGGMLVAKDPQVLERARAYHDHGHENNPQLSRWEDSRSGSGFNYRMNELQGAVGLAQLKKLNSVIDGQVANKNRIKSLIANIEGIKFRNCPENTKETADALIFFVKDKESAVRCRNELVKNGLSTKILPEAITWHFAGCWDHMPELTSKYPALINSFPRSSEILNKCVAIPISVKMDQQIPELIYKIVSNVLSK